ncbi:MAG: protein kinase [Thermoanaerobaculia bacterium]|nr:protein kinase [Thermoanaerobaculia bacterium]
MSVLLRPPEFDHYSVSRVLGEGGMGIVFLAEDRRTHLPVAVKVMSRSLTDPELQARFMKENQILASLNHRNIVRCYEITRSREGLPTIVMEYVKAVDFGAFEGRPFPELIPLMVQAAMGLAYLKERNILHRDLSPNNIMVTLQDERRLVKILDFGVAKVLQEGSGGELTQTGEFLGKLAYASHELLTFGQVDFRSDIYSLGVIFFRLLTKRRPINVQNSRNYLEWVMAQENRGPIDFAAPEGNPAIPDSLQALVLKMLAKKSEDRPQGYEEIIDALVAAQSEAEKSGLVPDPETVSTLPSPEARSSISGSAGTPASPAGSSPTPGGSGAAGLFDDGAFPFTEAETKAPSSSPSLAGSRLPAPAPAPKATPASQMPDWLEQADYNEQMQVISESKQGIPRSPVVHPAFGGESRPRPVRRDTESIRVRQKEASSRKRTTVLVSLLVVAILGGGAWAGWTFYVKPNLPSSSPEALALPAPPDPASVAPPTAPETVLPTAVPEPAKTVSRAAKLGSAERRLVDANVAGFYASADTMGRGLSIILEFRQPANVSGLKSARIVSATDASGRNVPGVAGATAEIRLNLNDDPTSLVRVRLFAVGENAAAAAASLRSISVEIGSATMRAKFDPRVLSR